MGLLDLELEGVGDKVKLLRLESWKFGICILWICYVDTCEIGEYKGSSCMHEEWNVLITR
jgi:hypothetical protein